MKRLHICTLITFISGIFFGSIGINTGHVPYLIAGSILTLCFIALYIISVRYDMKHAESEKVTFVHVDVKEFARMMDELDVILDHNKITHSNDNGNENSSL